MKYVSGDIVQQLSLPILLPSAKSTEMVALRLQSSRLFSFLDYAVQNLIFHAEEASDGFITPEEAAGSFPLSAWCVSNNLFERHDKRRYTSLVTKAYIFAEKGWLVYLALS